MLTPIPDASAHNPKDFIYFRRLLNACGFTYAEAAEVLGCSERTVATYANVGGYDYPAQFMLECYAVGLHRLVEKDANSSWCRPPESANVGQNNAELRSIGTANPRKISAGR